MNCEIMPFHSLYKCKSYSESSLSPYSSAPVNDECL
ncbi:hypothetical protein X975_01149, partial [Stegodyphus mimosarum]